MNDEYQILGSHHTITTCNKVANNFLFISEMSAGLRKPCGRSAGGQFTDADVDVSELSQYLSSFQIEKLSYLFKCLDTTGDGYVNVRKIIFKIHLKKMVLFLGR